MDVVAENLYLDPVQPAQVKDGVLGVEEGQRAPGTGHIEGNGRVGGERGPPGPVVGHVRAEGDRLVAPSHPLLADPNRDAPAPHVHVGELFPKAEEAVFPRRGVGQERAVGFYPQAKVQPVRPRALQDQGVRDFPTGPAAQASAHLQRFPGSLHGEDALFAAGVGQGVPNAEHPARFPDRLGALGGLDKRPTGEGLPEGEARAAGGLHGELAGPGVPADGEIADPVGGGGEGSGVSGQFANGPGRAEAGAPSQPDSQSD
jgi:hypothetical protein